MVTRKSVCLRGHLRSPENLYRNGHCKKCISERNNRMRSVLTKKRSEYLRKYYIKKRFGISYDDYRLRYLMQDGKCLICQDSSRVVLDHNHRTGKVRGFLCNNCNAMIGFAKDDPTRLHIAASYLEQYSR